MSDTSNNVDPITLQVLHNNFCSITDEAYIALMKSAYSTNIKERRDHSVALVDRHGRLIAQADNSLPIHLASMMGLVEVLLQRFRESDFADGDIFFANDPYVAGGTHLPDINLAMPLLAEGKLLGFVCNIAHHADMGGMMPGSMGGGMTEIFQEGLRLPVVKLFERGRLVQDMLDVFLLNTRVPAERRGDLFAQVAACRLAERRMRELLGIYPAATIDAAFAEIIVRTERRIRGHIARIPPGIYECADVLDDDGVETEDIPIRVSIEVRADSIRADFTASAPQVAGNINLTWAGTRACVCYAVKAMLDPEIPNNEGVLNAIEVVTRKGTILDAVFPASVAQRGQTCQRVADVTVAALGGALRDAAVGGSNGTSVTAVFTGVSPSSGEPYVYFESLGGGAGGRATKDGKDAVQVHITNTSNLPIEAIEMEYPLLVERYGLVEDSGGPGRHRGGLGIRRVVRPLGHTMTFSGCAERFRHPPPGTQGGGSGACGRYMIIGDDGTQQRLPAKFKAAAVRPDQCVLIESPGAGGFGPPKERDPELLAQDFISGKFSAAFLEKHYGRRPGARTRRKASKAGVGA